MKTVGPVALISDCSDVAFVEMRQSIYRAFLDSGGSRSALPLIEPLVVCEPFSVRHVSFLARLLAENALPGSIIMAINNPLRVRTERILGRTSSGVYFEGTNTGAFGWLVSDLGCDECIELNDPGFIPFGGKAVHAPALGRFLAGSALHELGIPFDCRKIRGDQPQSGEVIHIDNFGNAKLFLNSKLFASVKPGTPLFVDTPRAGIIQALYAARMMSLSDGEWVVYPGSSLGLLEMGQVRCPGVLQIDLAVGDTVRITL